MTITWGVDLSTHPTKTGVVALDWVSGQRAELRIQVIKHNNELLELMVHNWAHDVWWAVDVPFGWPDELGTWLINHAQMPSPLPPPIAAIAGKVSPPTRWSSVAARKTDYWVRQQLSLSSGFNVSFDKLGATAASWAVVEHDLWTRGLRVDRSGVEPPVVETWPSAAWRRFSPTPENPAALDGRDFEARLNEVIEFSSSETWQAVTPSARPHVQDAVVCALVARARALNLTELPSDLQHQSALTEGWIHIPRADASLRGLLT